MKSGYVPEELSEKHRRHEEVAPRMKALLGDFDTMDLGEVDLRPHTSPRHDQRSLGSCVAQSVVKALEIRWHMEHGTHKDFSVLAIYYLARELMRPPKVFEDSGTHISKACDALRKFGVCEEERWPYDISKFDKPPSWGSMRRAHVNKIDSHYRLTGHDEGFLEGVLLHLHSGNPVVFGTAVVSSFFRTGKDDVVDIPQGKVEGRHAMVVVGWLPDHKGGCFVIENSWGRKFGDDGFFYATPDYLMSQQVQDVWAIATPWDKWIGGTP